MTGTLFDILAPHFTYHVQDLAFKSWFYGDTPSVGVNGWYSLFGTSDPPPDPAPERQPLTRLWRIDQKSGLSAVGR